MKRPTGGQSSHTPGDDRNDTQLTAGWLDVPVELVWEFVVGLCARYTLRGVAEMTGLARETLRKYVVRKGTPSYATRKRLAELYLEFNAGGVVADEDNTKRWKARQRLIELLPPGKEAAREELAKLFELAKHGGELPQALVDQLHEWMDLQIRGEYWAEEYYGAIARGERKRQPKGQAKRPRKPRAKPPEDEGGSE